MKRTITVFSILLLGLIALSACSLVNKSPTEQVNLPSGTLLDSDDFSIIPNGWGTIDRSGGEIAYEYEGMTIKVNTPNFSFITVDGKIFHDSRIEIDAVLLEGPANDNFGVLCRFKDFENYYAFVISHDGYFGIYKVLDGVMVMGNQTGNLDYSDAIRKGGVVNHITATCQGDILSLSVNDTLLSQIQDSSFTEGEIGLIASAYSDPGVKVLFDNLEIYQP
ncbi:MAG: hypothetical protein CVU42_12490 [Chloroflexi bacterium HGW-Chloroflexi-4]|jgi:hypothetical protein|nr:MAG: hypothetical protein CVU42_12490 [Chloroflexi bacterium HGW-Chloroflexi-4]